MKTNCVTWPMNAELLTVSLLSVVISLLYNEKGAGKQLWHGGDFWNISTKTFSTNVFLDSIFELLSIAFLQYKIIWVLATGILFPAVLFNLSFILISYITNTVVQLKYIFNVFLSFSFIHFLLKINISSIVGIDSGDLCMLKPKYIKTK